jgi:hypothetical protein
MAHDRHKGKRIKKFTFAWLFHETWCHTHTHTVACTDMTIIHNKIHDSNYNNSPAMLVHNFSMPMEFFIRMLCGHDNMFVPLFCLIFTTATHTHTHTHTHSHIYQLCHFLITFVWVFDICNCCDFKYESRILGS